MPSDCCQRERWVESVLRRLCFAGVRARNETILLKPFVPKALGRNGEISFSDHSRRRWAVFAVLLRRRRQ